jgi:hypothetical protein
MRDDEATRTRRPARAFVPKITLRHAIAAVVPACALTTLGACQKTDNEHIIVLAMMAFDAAVDPPATATSATPDPSAGVIVLAAIGFDSALDAAAADTGAPRRRRKH